jgi:hypothetical protein
MRGKKSDPEFVSSYIYKCLQHGIITTPGIVESAKLDIQDIDDKIIEAEKLKVVRSKLLDVILTLEKPEPKTEEAKLLPFFQLQLPTVCKFLCDMVKLQPISITIVNSDELDEDAKFCFKQLLEQKIMARTGNFIVQGEKFNDYMEFVLREDT